MRTYNFFSSSSGLAVVLAGLAALTGGCSRSEFKTAGIEFKSPRGMGFIEEEAGPPPLVRFERGLELRSLPDTLGLEETPLPELLSRLREEVPGLPEKVFSAKKGEMPAGKVARFELTAGDTRTLLYAVDGPGRHLVVTLTAPERDFDRLANRLEPALSSLKFK